MESRRKKIFIFSGLIAGLIIALILIFVLLNRGSQPQTENPANSAQTSTNTLPLQNNGEAFQDTNTGKLYNTTVDLMANGSPKQDVTEQYLRQLASIFVERFNSYSNQDDNAHIEDAIAMSTDKMAQWITTQKVRQSTDYEAVVTEVFSTELEKLYDIRAVIKVQARIKNISSGGAETVEYKTGHVDLVEQVENEWLVDRFVWDE